MAFSLPKLWLNVFSINHIDQQILTFFNQTSVLCLKWLVSLNQTKFDSLFYKLNFS